MLGCRFDLTDKERLGRSGYAVGLSAISFSASLQKDAAPIPNALAAAIINSVYDNLGNLDNLWFIIGVPFHSTPIYRMSPLQGSFTYCPKKIFRL